MPDPDASSVEPRGPQNTNPFAPDPPLWQKILGVLLLIILLPFQFIWWVVRKTFLSFWENPWN